MTKKEYVELTAEIAVINEHLHNQDEVLEYQNKQTDKFEGNVRGKFQDMSKEIGQLKDSLFKSMIGIYTLIITLMLAICGWIIYSIHMASEIIH